MNEIERAIEQIKDHMRVHRIGQYPHVYIADALNMALDALKEKLEREKNPLKCDGCIHLPQKYNGSIACENCSRGTILLDRYEPKGEPNV